MTEEDIKVEEVEAKFDGYKVVTMQFYIDQTNEKGGDFIVIDGKKHHCFNSYRFRNTGSYSLRIWKIKP